MSVGDAIFSFARLGLQGFVGGGNRSVLSACAAQELVGRMALPAVCCLGAAPLVHCGGLYGRN